MNTWGGKRSHSGRKKGIARFKVMVSLDRAQRAFFKSLGGSKWLREQLEMLQSEQTAEKSGVM